MSQRTGVFRQKAEQSLVDGASGSAVEIHVRSSGQVETTKLAPDSAKKTSARALKTR